DLWDDADHARSVSTEYSKYNDDVVMLDGLAQRIDDAATLHELSREESDESVEPEIETAIAQLNKEFDSLELRSLFTDEYDEMPAICELHAGAGGTEAQDWAEMLYRMYARWAERRGFEIEVDDVTEGTEAGVLSTTFIIKGRYAYGLLKGERGTHRL